MMGVVPGFKKFHSSCRRFLVRLKLFLSQCRDTRKAAARSDSQRPRPWRPCHPCQRAKTSWWTAAAIRRSEAELGKYFAKSVKLAVMLVISMWVRIDQMAACIVVKDSGVNSASCKHAVELSIVTLNPKLLTRRAPNAIGMSSPRDKFA